MAAPKPQDPLEVLQLMVNDVLVQTGKALRASRKDGQGNIAQAHGSLQSRLPDTIRTFHSALDDLENDIIRAKSVLLRDLNQLRKENQPVVESVQQPAQQPQPVEAQSKSPMVIELESSPPPPNDRPMTQTKPSRPVAPFPDMGAELLDLDIGTNQPDTVMKEAPAPSAPETSAPGNKAIEAERKPPSTQAAPMPSMEETPTDTNMDVPNSAARGGNSELTFTNMEFTLAPVNNDNQNPPNTQEPSFDLTTFAPADGGDDLLTLESLLPGDSNNQSNAPSVPQPPADGSANTATQVTTGSQGASAQTTQGTQGGSEAPAASGQPGEEKKENNPDSAFDDLFYMDSGADFDAGDGLGDDTFDDLMNARDGNFGMMEHGDFDSEYFGLDKTD